MQEMKLWDVRFSMPEGKRRRRVYASGYVKAATRAEAYKVALRGWGRDQAGRIVTASRVKEQTASR